MVTQKEVDEITQKVLALMRKNEDQAKQDQITQSKLDGELIEPKSELETKIAARFDEIYVKSISSMKTMLTDVVEKAFEKYGFGTSSVEKEPKLMGNEIRDEQEEVVNNFEANLVVPKSVEDLVSLDPTDVDSVTYEEEEDSTVEEKSSLNWSSLVDTSNPEEVAGECLNSFLDYSRSIFDRGKYYDESILNDNYKCVFIDEMNSKYGYQLDSVFTNSIEFDFVKDNNSGYDKKLFVKNSQRNSISSYTCGWKLFDRGRIFQLVFFGSPSKNIDISSYCSNLCRYQIYIGLTESWLDNIRASTGKYFCCGWCCAGRVIDIGKLLDFIKWLVLEPCYRSQWWVGNWIVLEFDKNRDRSVASKLFLKILQQVNFICSVSTLQRAKENEFSSTLLLFGELLVKGTDILAHTKEAWKLVIKIELCSKNCAVLPVWKLDFIKFSRWVILSETELSLFSFGLSSIINACGFILNFIELAELFNFTAWSLSGLNYGCKVTHLLCHLENGFSMMDFGGKFKLKATYDQQHLIRMLSLEFITEWMLTVTKSEDGIPWLQTRSLVMLLSVLQSCYQLFRRSSFLPSFFYAPAVYDIHSAQEQFMKATGKFSLCGGNASKDTQHFVSGYNQFLVVESHLFGLSVCIIDAQHSIWPRRSYRRVEFYRRRMRIKKIVGGNRVSKGLEEMHISEWSYSIDENWHTSSSGSGLLMGYSLSFYKNRSMGASDLKHKFEKITDDNSIHLNWCVGSKGSANNPEETDTSGQGNKEKLVWITFLSTISAIFWHKILEVHPRIHSCQQLQSFREYGVCFARLLHESYMTEDHPGNLRYTLLWFFTSLKNDLNLPRAGFLQRCPAIPLEVYGSFVDPGNLIKPEFMLTGTCINNRHTEDYLCSLNFWMHKSISLHRIKGDLYSSESEDSVRLSSNRLWQVSTIQQSAWEDYYMKEGSHNF